jgi:hypothetical protein
MIPVAIKGLLAAWLAVWLPLHLLAYPVSTLLWVCGYGSVLAVIGVCLESRFLVSWQAVALLVPQALYVSEAFARLVTGARGGGTSYLFDPATLFDVRALSLFHFVMPAVLVWAVSRLGYDPRALWAQLATAVAVSIVSLPFGAINLWCVPALRHHVLPALLLAPFVVHLPAHWVLRRYRSRAS